MLFSLLASVVSTTAFFTPVVVLALLDMNSVDPEVNVSGVVVAPLMFVAGVGICHALSTWLIASGYTAFSRFTAGACLSVVALALVLAVPSVAIGCYIGMFTLRDAAAPVLVCALGAGLMAVPASAMWWLIAGRAHNKMPTIPQASVRY